MEVISATDVRKEWSYTLDSVVREKPLFIKRTRDVVMLTSLEVIENLLEAYSFHAEKTLEGDGSVTLRLKELELEQNAPDEDEAASRLAEKMLGYAEEFYDGFVGWGAHAQDKDRLRFVLKILVSMFTNDLKIIVNER